MKQHISKSDLDQLSEKGKERLRKWLTSKDGFKGAFVIGSWDTKNNKEGRKNYTIPRYIPLLSIGQMIEFLDEYFAKEQRDFDIRIHSAGPGWQVPGQRLVDLSIIKSEIEDEAELADALWEACKEVLEK